MQTFLAFLAAILGVINLLQWIASYNSRRTLRAKGQASFNQWYRVARLAEQIKKEPHRAVEIAATINGIADSARNETVAYSRAVDSILDYKVLRLSLRLSSLARRGRIVGRCTLPWNRVRLCDV
jgi:hypothetical protein